MQTQRILSLFSTAKDRIAFIHDDVTYTYGDILNITEMFIEEISQLGIKSGELVALNADYTPQTFCYILALSIKKCVIIPLSNNSVIESESGIEICGCDWLVVHDVKTNRFLPQEKRVPAKSDLLINFLEKDEAGVILFSSGSSGKPKAILHSIETILSKFVVPKKPTIAIPFLMIDHFGGINTIFGILCSLGTVVTVANRSIENICLSIERYKVELLPTTPSFLALMIASRAEKNYDLSSLNKITYGTEVMPEIVLKKMHELFPNVILQQTYGLSEIGVMQSKSREDGSVWVKIGGSGFETKVIENILWIKSQFSMIGYLNAPSEFDDEGWFNTQDIVETDGDYFKIKGRATDLINVGGQKVYPAEVENIILSLENIKDVSVYGEPHPLLGNIVVAKLQLIEPESLSTLKLRIRKSCLEMLAAFKAPVKIYLSDAPLYSSRQKKIRAKLVRDDAE
jgi:acyl-CoA synthetase (AMP-forming)/AMP-acid ligase II